MDLRTLWLRAADSLVTEYLHPDGNSSFDAVAVLTALEHTADALYWLDEHVSLFISEQTRHWYFSGMNKQADFTGKWQARSKNQKEGK